MDWLFQVNCLLGWARRTFQLALVARQSCRGRNSTGRIEVDDDGAGGWNVKGARLGFRLVEEEEDGRSLPRRARGVRSELKTGPSDGSRSCS